MTTDDRAKLEALGFTPLNILGRLKTEDDLERYVAERIYLASAQAASAEPAAWRDHVEQRLLTWRQSFVNKSGDQLALDDFMDKRSLDDLIDFVCDEFTTPASAVAPAVVTDRQIKYVPVDSRLRDANWRHPNDDEPCPPGCREALDQRGDDEGQGLDGYWKWGFKAGWNACAALATRTPEPQAERGKVLVPLRPTRAMDEVMQQDDWRWADLLEAAEAVTEEEYAQSDASDVPPTPETQAERAVEWDFNLWFVELMRLADCFNEASTLASERCRTALAAHAKLAGMHWRAAAKLRDAEPQPDSHGQAREGWRSVPAVAEYSWLCEVAVKAGVWPAHEQDAVPWTILEAVKKYHAAMLSASPTPDEQRAHDSSFPECSGEPASCPENEGFGCCKTATVATDAQWCSCVPTRCEGVGRCRWHAMGYVPKALRAAQDEQRAQAAQEDVAPTCPANIIEAISAYGDARADGDVQASMEALPRVITLIRTALAGRSA